MENEVDPKVAAYIDKAITAKFDELFKKIDPQIQFIRQLMEIPDLHAKLSAPLNRKILQSYCIHCRKTIWH